VDLFGDREWSYQLAEGGPITWPLTVGGIYVEREVTRTLELS